MVARVVCHFFFIHFSFLFSFLFEFSMGHFFPVVSQMNIMMFSVDSFTFSSLGLSMCRKYYDCCKRMSVCVWFVVMHLQVVSETHKTHILAQPYNSSCRVRLCVRENVISICRSWIYSSIKITRSYCCCGSVVILPPRAGALARWSWLINCNLLLVHEKTRTINKFLLRVFFSTSVRF